MVVLYPRPLGVGKLQQFIALVGYADVLCPKGSSEPSLL